MRPMSQCHHSIDAKLTLMLGVNGPLRLCSLKRLATMRYLGTNLVALTSFSHSALLGVTPLVALQPFWGQTQTFYHHVYLTQPHVKCMNWKLFNTCTTLTISNFELSPCFLGHQKKEGFPSFHQRVTKGSFTPSVRVNAVMTLVTQLSSATTESLQNGVSGVTQLWSMRAVLKASSQHWHWRLV